MKRKTGKWFVLVFMAAAMLALSSCGGGGGDHATGEIELNNNSVATIDGFYLAPTDQRSWGPNILAGPLFS